MPDYSPDPLDTSEVEIPKSLDPVTERLAKHVHDVWSGQRISEGWTHGPERNDELKEHPCLVEYDELPEVEKEYDRQTALATLKVIMKLGYQIVPPEDESGGDAQTELTRLAEAEGQLREGHTLLTADLRDLWEVRTEHLWALHPGLFEVLADTLLKRAYPLWANDVIIQGLKITPKSVRLRQLHALALMRTGRPRRAREILEKLINEDEKNSTSEALGLLASSHKILWKSASDETEQKDALAQCCDIYRTAFDKENDYYPGINAAAMAVVQGDIESGRKIAVKVKEICEQVNDQSYWILATIAEANLIGGKVDQAAEKYKEAVAAAPGDLASISSTRRQALMLAEKLGIDDSAIRCALPVPPVAVFMGLPCFRDGKTTLPTISDEAALKEELKEVVQSSQLKLGYASGVGAGDLDFLEAVLENEGEAHLVIPAPAEELYQFFTQSPSHGEDWRKRFESLLKRVSSVSVVSRELGSADPEVFRYTNRILAGAAVLKSKSLGTPSRLIELIEPGIAKSEALANHDIFDEIVPHQLNSVVQWGEPIPTETGNLNAEVKGILFADLKGYSKLPENQIPLFITEFLSQAADLCDSEPGLQFQNTWGDAFYLVFDSVRTAAVFARRLRTFIKDTDWIQYGFYQDFGIRIALHAGPLFSFDDPLLQKHAYTGQHASRAARIEPITDEGQIFVSEPFACLAAEGNAPELEFEYLGRRALAKKYGGEGLFMLL